MSRDRRLVGSPRHAGRVQLHQAVPLVERRHVIIEELRLNAPRRTTARELAERTGVSIRAIERDIARLADAGVPVRRDRGRNGGFHLPSASPSGPLRLTSGEVASLAASLVALGPYTTATSQSALTKLVDHLADSRW